MKLYAKHRRHKPHVYRGKCEVCNKPTKEDMVFQRVGAGKRSRFMCAACVVNDWEKRFLSESIEYLLDQGKQVEETK